MFQILNVPGSFFIIDLPVPHLDSYYQTLEEILEKS